MLINFFELACICNFVSIYCYKLLVFVVLAPFWYKNFKMLSQIFCGFIEIGCYMNNTTCKDKITYI